MIDSILILKVSIVQIRPFGGEFPQIFINIMPMSIHLNHGISQVEMQPASSTFNSCLFAEFQGGSFDAWGPTAPGTEVPVLCNQLDSRHSQDTDLADS